MEEDRYTIEPFVDALGRLLRQRSTDRLGRFSLAQFIPEVTSRTGLSGEYVRMQLVGSRPLRMDVIEAVAEALDKDPHYFAEYRTAWVRVQMAEHPSLAVKVHDYFRALIDAENVERERETGEKK